MSDLQSVRDLLTAPQSWLQGEYSDEPSKPTCWCLNGAVAHVGGFVPIYNILDAHPAIQILADLIEGNPEEVASLGASGVIANWNDETERTHSEVLALLDRAIETTNA